MKKYIMVLMMMVSVFVICGCGKEKEEKLFIEVHGDYQPGGIMIIGDSNTYNMPEDIINQPYVKASRGGWSSSEISGAIGEPLKMFRPGTIHIMVGTNDAALKQNPIQEYLGNMEFMFFLFECYGVDKIYVRSILPTGKEAGSINPIMTKYTEALRTFVNSLGTKYQYLDSRVLFLDKDGLLSDEYEKGDGFHLNDSGYSILRDHFNDVEPIVSSETNT